MQKYIRGTIEVGIPLIMLALLGGLMLSNYWAGAAVWLRTVCVILISIAAIAGLAMLGKPGGLASMGKDDE